MRVGSLEQRCLLMVSLRLGVWCLYAASLLIPRWLHCPVIPPTYRVSYTCARKNSLRMETSPRRYRCLLWGGKCGERSAWARATFRLQSQFFWPYQKCKLTSRAGSFWMVHVLSPRSCGFWRSLCGLRFHFASYTIFDSMIAISSIIEAIRLFRQIITYLRVHIADLFSTRFALHVVAAFRPLSCWPTLRAIHRVYFLRRCRQV